MNEEPHELNEPPKKTKGSPWSLLWLLIAFVPAALALATKMPQSAFLILNSACSLLVGFGVWRGFIKNKIGKGFAGLTTSALVFLLNFCYIAIAGTLFFFINLTIEIYRGCFSGHSGL